MRKVQVYDEWVRPGSPEEAEFRHHILALADSGWCKVYSTTIQIQ